MQREGIVFRATAHAHEVRCVIAAEELRRHFGASDRSESAFTTNRVRIEQLARRALDRHGDRPFSEVIIRESHAT